MAPSRCPHCQAIQPPEDGDSVTFCGACGRKIEGWSKAPAGWGAGDPVPVSDLPDGAALTRKASLSTAEREALRAKPDAPSVAAGDVPAGETVKIVPPSSTRTTGQAAAAGSASQDFEAVASQGPRLVGYVVLALGAGTIAAGIGFTAYRHFSPPPASARVSVNLDAPPAPLPLAQPVGGSRRKRSRGSKGPVPAVAPTAGAAPVVAATGKVAAPVAPAPAVTSPAAPSPVTTPAASSTPLTTSQQPAPSPAKLHAAPAAAVAPTAPIEMPDDTDEVAPATEEEQREQAEARTVADGIVFVLRSHRSQVTGCYERAFKSESAPPSVRVDVDFTVDAAGKAQKVAASRDTSGSAQLAPCLVKLIAEWQFPKPPSGDFATSYPFVFSGS